jgi:hypothetical protein
MKLPALVQLSGTSLMLLALAAALSTSGCSNGQEETEDDVMPEVIATLGTLISTTEPNPSPEEDSLTAYEDELLAILHDNNEANEPLALALVSYYSCSTDVACVAAGDALVEELRRYRPALVDTIDRVRVLGEPPNLAYEEFTPKYLAMSELRLEAVDDLVEGWETYNDPLFIEGGNKWTEAGEIYFEIVEQLLAD